MNKFQQFNTIDFVFQNCEHICIDTRAIGHMRFKEDGKRYTFERFELYYVTDLKRFYIELDLSNPEWYWHLPGQKNFNDDLAKNITDGEDCVNRLKYCDDLTSVCINGVEFHIPWKIGSRFSNDYQKNEIKQSNGRDLLNITIMEPEVKDE